MTATAIGNGVVIQGACDSVLPATWVNQASLVIADPPYNINWSDYGIGWSDNQNLETYLEYIQRWARVACGVLRPGGVCLWYAASQNFYDVKTALDAADTTWTQGWSYRRTLIWRYTFGQNQKKDWVRAFTPILVYVRNGAPPAFSPNEILTPSYRALNKDKRCANPAGKTPDDVFEVPRVVGNSKERCPWIDTQLPVRLVKTQVLAYTQPGDLVVDPFLGSGTTGVVCEETDRCWVGVELNELTAGQAAQRIRSVRVPVPSKDFGQRESE